MTSNPVKGPSPSDPIKGSNETRTSSSPHRKIEKVEKVGEVDPEQQSRARKFRALVEEETPDDSANSQHPSPITLFSTEDKPKSKPESKTSFSSDEPATVVPSPAYSPPPNIVSGSGKEDVEEDSALPQSEDFWTDIDEPIQEPPKKPTFTEKLHRAPEKHGAKKKKEEFIPSAHLGIPIKKEPSPYDLMTQKGSTPINPKKESEDTSEEGLAPIAQPLRVEPEPLRDESKPIKEPIAPMSRHLNKDEEKITISAAPEKKSRFEKEKLPSEKKGKLVEKHRPQSTQDETVTWAPTAQFEDKERREKKKEEIEIEVASPTHQPLPVDIIPIATAATAAAMPYLKPETMSLFYQMVGTIYVMATPPGVSRTEIVLNAASYAQSKFYGASIIIEKYASAPDSFNIRLTGSNEAVTAFNQNIPTLMAAFQKGNFSFGIGRIEAEYKSEKALFRRKEKRGGNDLGNSSTDKGTDQ